MPRNVDKAAPEGAGAPEDKAEDTPEITPEMIKAGAAEIEDQLMWIWNPSRGSAATLAEDVLSAAFRAKNSAVRQICCTTNKIPGQRSIVFAPLIEFS